MTNSIHEPTPSPLRVRMLEDMKGQRLSGQTQKAYLRSVEKFALFLRRSPETATRDDFRRIQLHFAESQIGSGKINSHVTVLRAFLPFPHLDFDFLSVYCGIAPKRHFDGNLEPSET